MLGWHQDHNRFTNNKYHVQGFFTEHIWQLKSCRSQERQLNPPAQEAMKGLAALTCQALTPKCSLLAESWAIICIWAALHSLISSTLQLLPEVVLCLGRL